MKKLLSSIAIGLLLTSSLWAVPSLQLDIEGGVYVGGTDETTYSNGPVFNLLALGLAPDPLETYFISAAIVPKQPSTIPPFGSFTIDGVPYNNGNMLWGTPPVDNPNTNPHLGGHGIYDTAFAEIAFSFVGTPLVPSYNTQDGSLKPGEFLNQKTFAVDVTGLIPGYAVHFDLYTKDFKNRTSTFIIGDFAPFSHDAQSGKSGNGVPDGGATIMLLGSALACLGALRRRFA